jgi:glycogen synthase
MMLGNNGRRNSKIAEREAANSERSAEPVDVVIVGPHPPPAGGVSSHIARSAPLLIRHGLAIKVLSHYGPRPDVPYVLDGLRRNPLRYFFRIRASDARLVHYHYSGRTSLVSAALGLAMRPPCARIITIHSPTIARDLQRRPRWVARWSLRRFDHIVAVTPEIVELLRPIIPNHTFSVVPDFVPQPVGGELPPSLASFVESGDVFVAAAWRLKFLPSGDDLYGFDVLANAFLKVAARSGSARLVLLIGERPGRRGRRYLRSIQALLDGADLGARYMIGWGVDLTPLLSRGVTLVRPTRSDGDAVSIREALGNGRNVIATDVANRPAGVSLVPVGDSTALAAAMEESISSGHLRPDAPPPSEAGQVPEHFASLLSIYRRYLSYGAQ